MISECVNPACRKELHYLRDGRVVRLVKRDREPINVEHFWLCGSCHLIFDFHFSQDGEVSLIQRVKAAPAKTAVGTPYVLTLVA